MDFDIFWKEFLENVDMVVGYHKACKGLASFLRVHGTPEKEVPNIHAAIKIAKEDFIAQEQYELCMWLETPFTMEAHPMALDRIRKEVKVITSLEDNCDVVYEVLRYMGAMAFDEIGYLAGSNKNGMYLIEKTIQFYQGHNLQERAIFLCNLKTKLFKW